MFIAFRSGAGKPEKEVTEKTSQKKRHHESLLRLTAAVTPRPKLSDLVGVTRHDDSVLSPSGFARDTSVVVGGDDGRLDFGYVLLPYTEALDGRDKLFILSINIAGIIEL